MDLLAEGRKHNLISFDEGNKYIVYPHQKNAAAMKTLKNRSKRKHTYDLSSPINIRPTVFSSLFQFKWAQRQKKRILLFTMMML